MNQHEFKSAPFFIVGAHRSGTTLLRLILNNHPHLAVPFESVFIPVFYKNLREYGDLSLKENLSRLIYDIGMLSRDKKGELVQDPEAILSLPISNYAGLVDAIFMEYAERKGKRRWGDKTPSQVMELDILWKLFPDCRVIHLVRDGRDVALSLRRISWGSAHIPRVAADWRWMTILGRKMGAFLGDHYLEVRYEDLVLKPEETLRRICAFLEEPYHEDLLRFHVTAEKEMPSESMKWHQNSVKPPDPSKVFMWKHQMSLADRFIFEQIAGPELELFGYIRENHPRTWRSRLKTLYYYTLKRW